VLDKLPFPVSALTALVVDGYVWLGPEQAGMGHHLFEATRVPVIGVAKNAFANNDVALPLLRGTSQKPLYVTAVGMDPLEARRRHRGHARRAPRADAAAVGGQRVPAGLSRRGRAPSRVPA
jgi:deoxyinosine 3'endonuclease (endonuclease V)